MKKLLLILMVVMLSLQGFATKNPNVAPCTAHYYLKVFDEDGTNYRTIVIHNTIQSGDCALAMAQAKQMAWAEL